MDKFPEMMKHLETEEMVKQRERPPQKKRVRKSTNVETNVSYATKSRRTVYHDQAGQKLVSPD